MFEQLKVAVLVAKLPTTWNDYKKKLLHTIKDFTIDQLIKHILIEEETHICKSKFIIEIGTKVNYVKSKKIRNGS